MAKEKKKTEEKDKDLKIEPENESWEIGLPLGQIEEFKTLDEPLEKLIVGQIKKVVITRAGANPILFRIYKSQSKKTYTMRVGEFS